MVNFKYILPLPQKTPIYSYSHSNTLRDLFSSVLNVSWGTSYAYLHPKHKSFSALQLQKHKIIQFNMKVLRY